MHFFKVALLTLPFLLITSCRTGYRAQPLEIPENALEKSLFVASSDPYMQINETLPSEWWSLFADPQLSHFILLSYTNNPNLQEARTKICKAKFVADQIRSTLFPTLLLGGDVSRQKLSETGLIPFDTDPTNTNTVNINPPIGSAPIALTAGRNRIPVYFTQYETELILTYDFDVWGKNRNALKAAIGEMRARIADEKFYRLQLGIAVARAYYQLQIDYRRKELATRLMNNQATYFELINQRVLNNLDNGFTFHTSQFNYISSKQQLLQIEANIIANEHLLKAFIAGNFEEIIEDISISEQSLPQIPIPKNLPVNLLSQRPDIMAQLWLIQSAGKRIEVAKAGFYPDFNITALYGFQTLHLNKLFEYPSTYYNIDPAFTLPIFDGGRLIANLNNSEVDYDLAIFRYNEMVLNAVKEVLDGIELLHNSQQQLQDFKGRVFQQEELLKLADLRLQYNISSSLEFLINEQNMLLAKDLELISLGNMIQSMLSLIKALGGGYNAWDEDC